ncbi:FecR domain-containing protein [Reichenbachiella sp. MALMAid0571]|uniref:FecR family protein n=1 Tax=Reichenbachiella sp. MALMAid0571 TaxID=3143939 RepID=UPI0032E03131
MNYSEYSLEDFLNDEYFIEWVTNPSPECNYFWKNWMAKHPKNAQIIYLAKGIIDSLEYKNSVYPTSDEKLEVLENIIKKSGKKEIKFSGALKIAAVVAVLLGFAALFYVVENQKTEDLVSTTYMVSKQTKYGEKKTFRLPDGTEVKLNYGSKLLFPSEFEGETREVSLIGEAFFEVNPNPDKPFIITTNNVQTMVLGTSFNINAYSDEDEIKVMVATGKVRVQNGLDSNKLEDVVLLPDEMVSLHKVTGRVVKEKCDLSEHLAWKDGKIVFRRASFDEVVNRLEKWYGVTIQIDEDIQIKGKFNGAFDNQSLENVLRGFSFSNLIEFKLINKTVKIQKNEKN